jgi:Bacterial Ig-like domain (group 3)
VRRLFSRGLRLEVVAGLGITLAVPALAIGADDARGVATQTTMAAQTTDQGGRTRAAVSIDVIGEDGLPASGAVAITDHGKPLAGVALNAEGKAKTTIELVAGEHSLKAVYQGDQTHAASTSAVSGLQAMAAAAPDFSVAVAPATLSLKQGQSGAVSALVTAINPSSLPAPIFVTLSCAGLPDQTKCTFTPENVQITPAATTAISSSMVIATQAGSLSTKASPAPGFRANPVAWAVLLPGGLGLTGLAFAGRRRRWLSRVTLLALVGVITLLGTTACSPLYYYREHGPTANLPTPTGTFNVTIAAQSSNGVTATTHFATMALTVTQ